MLVKKLLKISVFSASFFILAACSTGPEDSTADNLSPNGTANKAIVSGAGDISNFPNDEANTNPLQVGNQTYYFDFDKSAIQSTDIPSLKIQARYLINHPQTKILIIGNTDERGSREYNIGLGLRRALSVAHFLRAEGVNKDQILTVSYGAEKPVAFGHSEADYGKNRRANLQYQTPIITDNM
jgi:peptidoglycan-associated lipoprotein